MVAKILFFFGLLFLSVIGNAQENDTLKSYQNTEINIINTSGIRNARKLRKRDVLTIKIKGQDEPIVGYYSLVNDSTMLIDNKIVPFSTIESIRTKNKSSILVGSVVLSSGVLITTSGIILLVNAKDEDLLSNIVLGAIGGGAIIIGNGITIIGVVVLANAVQNYPMEKWHLYVDPEI